MLDLDETLIHFNESEQIAQQQRILKSFERRYGRSPTKLELSKILPLEIQFNTRPGCLKFLTELSKYYEIVVFTAAEQDYADDVIDQLDKQGLIKHRLYRQHAIHMQNNYT